MCYIHHIRSERARLTLHITESPLNRQTESSREQQNWTTRSLLEWMRGAFESRGIDSPRLCSEMLLTHVIGCDRMHLYAYAERPASEAERDALRELVSRALKQEPIQYLVGEAWFFSHPFTVDRRVLIPRPSTETMLEHALQWLRGYGADGPLRLADVCTGSGCIAISALKNLPGATCVATDLSPEALEVARANAQRHGVSERIEFIEGDLDAPLDGRGPFDLILSNPPYIPDHEWASVEANVKDHEPTMALRAGETGMDSVAPLIERLPERLNVGGRVSIELAACNAGTALELAREHPKLSEAETLRDLDGLDRVLTALRV